MKMDRIDALYLIDRLIEMDSPRTSYVITVSTDIFKLINISQRGSYKIECNKLYPNSYICIK